MSMAEESAFRDVIGFLEDIGIYDVVLPFLLVFTIVFAILEKTKIFGTDEIEGKKYTKKNINAMVAFVTGFFVVASTKLVKVISESVANVVLLLLLSVLFLMLVGSFFREGEDVYLKGAMKTIFFIIMFVGIMLIFLNALGWLSYIGDFFADNIGEPWLVSIIMVVVLVIIMYLIVAERKPVAAAKQEESSEEKE